MACLVRVQFPQLADLVKLAFLIELIDLELFANSLMLLEAHCCFLVNAVIEFVFLRFYLQE